MRLALCLLLFAAAGCATDEDAAGTSNPDVVTPAEAPPELGADAPSPPDAAGSLPDSIDGLVVE